MRDLDFVICDGCGETFPRRESNPKTRYCSFDCFKQSRWAIVVCFECGEDFKKRICEIEKAKVNGYRHMCSRTCRNAYTSKLLGGDGTWVVGGKYARPRKRRKEWRAARAYALWRDDYTCQECGAKEDPLEVHHWEPYQISFNDHPDNLVVLCRQCHKDKHEEYRREGFYEDLHR